LYNGPALAQRPAHEDIGTAARTRLRIRQALDRTHGNVSRAARLLGIERTSLHKRIRALGLNR
jgi:transcriptional regulator of acetoin/glycerol metabolism